MALNDIYYIKEKLKSEFWDFFSALGRRPRTWERNKFYPSPEDRGSEKESAFRCSNFHIPPLVKMIRAKDECRDNNDGDHRVDRGVSSFENVLCIVVLEER